MMRDERSDRYIYHKPSNDLWRVFVGPTSTIALSPNDTGRIIAKLKPVLDLITPTQNTHRDWVYWIITEDEYESLMGENNGSAT